MIIDSVDEVDDGSDESDGNLSEEDHCQVNETQLSVVRKELERLESLQRKQLKNVQAADKVPSAVVRKRKQISTESVKKNSRPRRAARKPERFDSDDE